jgi:hypothetical protein
LNLQRAANCVINLDLPWNPAVLEQRIGRIYRLGQKQPIDVYNLISEQGIESRIAILVDTKHAFFKGLFDGDTDTIQFGEASGMLARLQKLIDPSAIAVVAERGEQAEADADQGDVDIDLDDDVADPVAELIESADEAEDAPAVPPPAAVADGQAGSIAAAAPAAPAPAAPSRPGGDAEANGGPRPSPGGDVRGLFAQLQVRREPSGKVVIEAPPEAAGALSALFEGMAALLQSVARPGG